MVRTVVWQQPGPDLLTLQKWHSYFGGKLWHGKNERLNCQNFSSNLFIMGETQSAIWNFQLPISCDRVYLQFYINRVLLIWGQNRWWGLRTGVLWWGKHKQEYKKYKSRHCWFWPQILCSWHLPQSFISEHINFLHMHFCRWYFYTKEPLGFRWVLTYVNVFSRLWWHLFVFCCCWYLLLPASCLDSCKRVLLLHQNVGESQV